MECYYCNQDVNPNKYFTLNGEEYCSRKCMMEYITNNKVCGYDTLGGENDFIIEKRFGYPLENLEKKISIFYDLYPKDKYMSSHTTITKEGMEYTTTTKRLKKNI